MKTGAAPGGAPRKADASRTRAGGAPSWGAGAGKRAPPALCGGRAGRSAGRRVLAALALSAGFAGILVANLETKGFLRRDRRPAEPVFLAAIAQPGVGIAIAIHLGGLLRVPVCAVRQGGGGNADKERHRQPNRVCAAHL